MDHRTTVLAKDVTDVIHHRQAIAQELEALETIDGVAQMVDQPTKALTPLHRTGDHPGVMLGVALCAGTSSEGRGRGGGRPLQDFHRLPPPGGAREAQPSGGPHACSCLCHVTAK